jgi:predicted  nucleic acid-binding Zn-ribbon protein
VSKASTLYALQQIDSDLDTRKARLADVEARIGPSEAVAAAQAALDETRAAMEGVQRRVREAETEAADLQSKIDPLEKKLYGGTIRNPRELQDLQQDIASIQAQKRRVEDRDLDAMVELETLQEQAAAQQAELTALTEAWEAEQADLAERRTSLLAEIERLTADSEAQAARADAASLAQYRALRAKRPLAVAAVVQGQCQGCRIGQPTTLLQRARNPELIVPCASCGRILYMG